MQRQTVKPMGVGKPRAVPNPGPGSLVAPSGAAPKPGRVKNTRDYGKGVPAPAGPGPGSVNPFGPTEGGSRLGGI